MGKEARLKQERRQERIAHASKSRRKKGGSSVFIVVGLILVLAIGGVIAMNLGGDTLATGDVTVTGGSLATYIDNDSADPVLGKDAPALAGIDLDGNPLTIAPGSGKPMIILFLAHWCPHCNAELDELIPHLAENPIEGVDLVAVSTFADPAREHYPPTTWLKDRDWTYPTLLDSDDVTAGDAYGISGTPFWAYLDADGKVVGRWSGELGLDEFDATVERLKS